MTFSSQSDSTIPWEKNHQSQMNSNNTSYTTTLALLYPPGLIGGYRNQVMRLIAFCVYAKQNGHGQLLLPSLLWTTEINDDHMMQGTNKDNSRWFPVPFSRIFDVEHWNTFQRHLPKLVDPIANDGDCWMSATELPGYQQLRDGNEIESQRAKHASNNNMHYYHYSTNDETRSNEFIINHLQRMALLQGTLRPVSNISIPTITRQIMSSSRKEDFFPLVQNCTNPFVYGGGTKSGRLWNDFLHFRRDASAQQQQPAKSGSVVPYQTDVWVYRALRPASQWRDLAEMCSKSATQNGHYIALHARVELEMMNHRCGATMEKNLTKIIEQVYDLHYSIVENGNGEPASGLFLAVSRDGMKFTNTRANKKFKKYAKENLRTLHLLSTNHSEALFGSRKYELPVFECGKQALMEYYAQHPDVPNHGSLVESVINFHVAISADMFVGVKGSSFSNDIWTTRYWQGKGDTNYEYTLSGIVKVENNGLPEPHRNCKTINNQKESPR
jgi:hypothetical protein